MIARGSHLREVIIARLNLQWPHYHWELDFDPASLHWLLCCTRGGLPAQVASLGDIMRDPHMMDVYLIAAKQVQALLVARRLTGEDWRDA